MPHPRLVASLAAALTLGLAAVALRVRSSDARPAATAPHGHVVRSRGAASDSLTATARDQLARARRATAGVATPEAARAAGYRPMFGHVPLQGEHYVRVDLVMNGAFDLERPSVLMFSPVRGVPTLVGVAYAFMHPAGAPPPAGFDGAGDVWHAHERLATTPGKHLVMMHAWFVDAAGGAFARYNEALPYLAAGLTPPSPGVLADSAAGERARRVGFALASAVTPPMLFQWLERQGDSELRDRAARHRAAIEASASRLAAAERAGERAGRTELVNEIVAHGDALAAVYRDAAPSRPLVRRLVDRTVDEFLGRGHGIEEELGALLSGGGGPPHAHRP